MTIPMPTKDEYFWEAEYMETLQLELESFSLIQMKDVPWVVASPWPVARLRVRSQPGKGKFPCFFNHCPKDDGYIPCYRLKEDIELTSFVGSE